MRGEFINYLHCEFHNRVKRNPQYSLRAYAKALGINPGCLSAILNNKRPVTLKMFKKLCDNLALPPEDRTKFIFFDEYKESSELKSLIRKQSEFDLIGSWYYDAIIELVKLKDFKNDYIWISKKLGITQSQAKIAVQRLIEYKFLKEIPSKKKEKAKLVFCDIGVDAFVNSDTTPALKNLQLEANELSRSSLEKDPVKKRYHAINTIAVRKDCLEEAKNCLRKFRDEFTEKFGELDSADRVFQLNLSFYGIDKI